MLIAVRGNDYSVTDLTIGILLVIIALAHE